MKSTVIEDDDRQHWLEKRLLGLGGSDAPVILGLSPWKSPLALWAEKTGLIEGDNLGANEEAASWGAILEQPIAQAYVRVTGRTLIDHGRYAIHASEAYPFMHATIDREIIPLDGRGPGSLSIKTASGFKYEQWDEEPPLFYQVQLQHELIVKGWQWGSFAVLIGGQKFRWCDAERNERFCSSLIEHEETFWHGVIHGIPPEVDASDSSRETLLRMYPKDTGESIELPPEAIAWDEQLQFAKAEIKGAEFRKQQAENFIKNAIGNASFGLLPGGSAAYSWKTIPRTGYVVQPSNPRILRRVKS